MATTDEWGLDRLPAAPNPKVLITGTGRAGTTLLVQVLTDLGLDTGMAPDAPIDERAAAGLELPVDDPHGPRIVKSPSAIPHLGAMLDDGIIAIEHVIIPIRDLEVATASRVRLTRYGSNLRTWGGLTGTVRATRQREALALLEYELFRTIARHSLPHTLLDFPRFAYDWEYTFRSLSFLDTTVAAESWRDALRARYRPQMVHQIPLSRNERMLTRAGTVYNRGLARPARIARKILSGQSRRTKPKDPLK